MEHTENRSMAGTWVTLCLGIGRIVIWGLVAWLVGLVLPRPGAAEELAFATAPLAVVDVFTSAHLIETPTLLKNPPAPRKVVDEAFTTEGLEGWTVDTSPGAAGAQVRVATAPEGRSGRGLVVRGGANVRLADVAASAFLEVSDTSLTGPPAPRPKGAGPWCQLWRVAGLDPLVHRQLDGAIADGLRALGYL